jgi:hypothetical protein
LITIRLFGITPTDPVTAIVILGTVALATWLPAYRASRVDPLIALRSEYTRPPEPGAPLSLDFDFARGGRTQITRFATPWQPSSTWHHGFPQRAPDSVHPTGSTRGRRHARGAESLICDFV